MTEHPPRPDPRAAIDRRIDAALAPDRGPGLASARAAVEGFDDRWYGRLAIRSHAAAAGADGPDPGPAPDAARSAAAAVELLRGYCRVRGELLCRVEDDASPADVRSALLAGDVLYAAAYSSLGRLDAGSADACFEPLVAASETVVETFAASHARPTTADRRDLFDGTAGALGRGAAAIGAALAGADADRRDRFAALGHDLGTARGIRSALGPDLSAVPAAPEADERALRRHAANRLAEATRACRDLPPAVDTVHLRPAFEAVEREGE
ncbi:polyprenyl synthetase [Halostella litorea]|uniref:polyprenyl synthetase n=1 Tax=Halostella litorea TaxID=2528831 RepID=UPI00109204AE|nr:polyprenyl synthetase [Halostella litorea]